MRRWLAYVAVSTVLVVGVQAAAWSVMGPGDRRGLVWAGALALGVQWLAFGWMMALRDRGRGFLLAMAGGTAARFGVLGVAGVVVTVAETGVGAGALLFGLAGFLFALALLEAVFLRGGDTMGQSG